MRWFAYAAALGLALASSQARAEEAQSPASAVGPEPTAPAPKKPLSRWGLLLDAGFPEGASAGAVFRPVSEVRFWVGPTWSFVAFGVQGGVTIIPWHIGISPLLSLEAGRYFAADATFLAKGSNGVPKEIEPLLERVSYDYAAAHLGFEIGTKNGLGLSLRAGLAYVSLLARGTATTADSGGSGTVVTFTDPRVRATVPSVKLGVQLWF